MNQFDGAAAVVTLLQKQGVKHIFGLCGDTSLPLYDALCRLDHGMTHVLTRDERSAGYMSDVYARVSSRVGVCEGPSGGGATYIAPALVEANDSSSAIVAITTDVAVASRGRFPLTELDQAALFRPLTKWNTVIGTSAQIPHVLRRAFVAAAGGKPGSVHLGLPIDVQRGPVDEEAVWGAERASVFPNHLSGPDPDMVTRAARLLREAARPVIVAGGGPVISGAMSEMAAFAERIGAPVLTSVSGKGIIADPHALAGGVVGSNGGTLETRKIVSDADVVVFVGCRAGSVTTEKWQYPRARGCRVVHIDVDPDVIGVSYPVDVALVGDARLVLAALLSEVDPAKDRLEAARAQVASAKASKRARFDTLAASNDRPVRPERLVAALNACLPEDAVLVADPGTPCPYLSAYYELRRAGRYFVTNRAHGALGYSLPGVVGAQFARPRNKCVAVMGDGSFGFASGELETIVRHQLPVTLVVVANASYGWIKAGQATGFGGRFYSVDFKASDHAAIGAAYGLTTWRVEDPRALEGTLRAAVAADGPTLVEVVSQPLHEAAAPVSEWIA